MTPPNAPDAGGTRLGRPVDRSSDAEILASTLDLLVERDYERLTVDEVAARTGKAKTTLYRRWATKEELVLGAIRSIGHPPEVDRLPDLGSLRADLLAVIDSPWLGGPERRIAIFASLASATRTSQRLAAAIRTEVTAPYVEVYRRLLERAAQRGAQRSAQRGAQRDEIFQVSSARIAVLADVIPALTTHRSTLGRGELDREYFVSVIDDVVLAALRAPA